MSKKAALVIVSIVAALVMTSPTFADGTSVSTTGPVQSPGSGGAGLRELSLIAAIKDEQTSIIRAAPKCQDTALSGTLVMETPPRDGFPLTATTFASPTGTFTTVTTTGDESPLIIDEVGKTLNSRADNYVKKLLRSCSL